MPNAFDPLVQPARSKPNGTRANRVLPVDPYAIYIHDDDDDDDQIPAASKGKGKPKEPLRGAAGPSQGAQLRRTPEKDPKMPTQPIPPTPIDAPLLVNPASSINSVDKAIALVLEIVPDVQPEHLLKLVTEHLEKFGDNVHEAVLHALFEDPAYPKVDLRKRKRPSDDVEEEEEVKRKAKEPKIDYTSPDRPHHGGPHYTTLAMAQLFADFPLIPVPHVRKRFLRYGFYVPAHIQLEEDQAAPVPPYKPKVQPTRNVKGKGKEVFDQEFETERVWFDKMRQDKLAANDEKLAEEIVEKEAELNGSGIECGCCFGDFAFDNMIQCPDAHLFCKTCARMNAQEAIGNRKTEILCMDQSGCKMHFHISQIERFLPEKTIALWERIKQEKALEQAEIEGLESCPFCSYSVVIENEQEKLFRCESEDCGAVSCRQCKRPDHLPKSCKEMDADRKLDARHEIEEAMTAALTRKCPKCTKPFIKTDGCNKMTCPSCGTLSCYLCRVVINGYDHFNQMPGAPANQIIPGKCALWDAVEKRGHVEVAEAARIALEKYRKEHADEGDVSLDIEMPEAPPDAAGPAPPHQQAVAAAPGVVQNPYVAMANAEMQLAQERQRQQYLQAQLLQIQQAREAAQAAETAARAAQAIRADLERQNAIRRRQALMQAALQPPVPRRRARDAPARPARPEWH